MIGKIEIRSDLCDTITEVKGVNSEIVLLSL